MSTSKCDIREKVGTSKGVSEVVSGLAVPNGECNFVDNAFLAKISGLPLGMSNSGPLEIMNP